MSLCTWFRYTFSCNLNCDSESGTRKIRLQASLSGLGQASANLFGLRFPENPVPLAGSVSRPSGYRSALVKPQIPVKSHHSLGARPLEDVLDMLRVHFTGLVVQWFAARVQYDDMRDIAPVILLDQFLLFG